MVKLDAYFESFVGIGVPINGVIPLSQSREVPRTTGLWWQPPPPQPPPPPPPPPLAPTPPPHPPHPPWTWKAETKPRPRHWITGNISQ